MFGKRLKEIRNKHRVNQKIWAGIIGYTSDKMSRVESENSHGTFEELETIIVKLPINIEEKYYLATGEKLPRDKTNKEEQLEKELDLCRQQLNFLRSLLSDLARKPNVIQIGPVDTKNKQGESGPSPEQDKMQSVQSPAPG